MRKAFIAFLLLAAATLGLAQSRFVHTRGKILVAPDGKPLLLRGTNLGNWMEPEGYMFGLDGGPQSPREIEAFFNQLVGPEAAAKFWQDYRDAYITEDDMRFLHQTGINSVRSPLHYKFFVAGNDEGFRLLDRVVALAHQYGIYVILDMHCAPGGQTGTNIDDSWGYPWLYTSPAAQQQLIAIWRRIAAHYAANPTVLGYDLLNEPIPNYPRLEKYNPDLEPIYRRVAAAIRQVDPNHVLILGGAQWDSNFAVFGTPFDKNVMYTFHKYWTAPTTEVIQQYLDFRDRYNVPIWIGESGENSDQWIASFHQTLESNNVGWAFWPYKKMDAPSAFVSFPKPEYWDEIVAFAKLQGSTGDAEKLIAARPSLEHSRLALQQILVNIRLSHCRVNPGYLQALGLNVPQPAAQSNP
ncbi:MAG TPA: glycoside hydrolase family 5 protein [Terracidiphilus sp.]|nr:glycoside hydrolase family 5 protein [Terracidiphilus sp.]